MVKHFAFVGLGDEEMMRPTHGHNSSRRCSSTENVLKRAHHSALTWCCKALEHHLDATIKFSQRAAQRKSMKLHINAANQAHTKVQQRYSVGEQTEPTMRPAFSASSQVRRVSNICSASSAVDACMTKAASKLNKPLNKTTTAHSQLEYGRSRPRSAVSRSAAGP
jgi:hypothetical protein